MNYTIIATILQCSPGRVTFDRMNLNAYAAKIRLELFDDLKSGKAPRVGTYEAHVLEEARKKGSPQVGSTRFEPDKIHFEYIYPDPQSTATILTLTIGAPERIVFLPVPSWVVESIWQGEISGSFHFESEALRLAEEFKSELSVENNPKWFGPQLAKRRE